MEYAIEKELKKLLAIPEFDKTPKEYYSGMILEALECNWEDAADLLNMASALGHCMNIIVETLIERVKEDESSRIQDNLQD